MLKPTRWRQFVPVHLDIRGLADAIIHCHRLHVTSFWLAVTFAVGLPRVQKQELAFVDFLGHFEGGVRGASRVDSESAGVVAKPTARHNARPGGFRVG